MNQDEKKTPYEWLAALCQKYNLEPQVVITFGWICLVREFQVAGDLSEEVVNDIRAFRDELPPGALEAISQEPKTPKIVEAKR